MSNRPPQHQLEDLSKLKFQLLLPKRWVFRDKNKDYGIDGEVELFDNENIAQGLLFFVQLKATESIEKSDILNVDIKIKTLKYYKRLKLPVLLVRYDSYNDVIYIKWINNVDFFNSKTNAKTFRIKISEEDRWDDSSEKKILNYLINIRRLNSGNISFPIPVKIDLKESEINGYSKALLSTQIKKHLGIYSDTVKFSSNEYELKLEVELTNLELKIGFYNLSGCTFHRINTRNKEDFAETIANDIILGLAYSFLEIGKPEIVSKMIFELHLENYLEKKQELFIVFLPILLQQSSYLERALDWAGNILDQTDSPTIKYIINESILTLGKSRDNSKNIFIENFLLNRLKFASSNLDKNGIAIAHYNLGNFYRAKGNYLKSINQYLLAKRKSEIYLNQHYFYKELAGVLFLSGKYTSASTLYEKSIELGSDDKTKGLYADSLMCAGKYELANIAFLEYINSVDNPVEEFLLKHICLDTLIKRQNIKIQNRKTDEANKLADIKNLNEGDPVLHLEKALQKDLLNPLAWYNYGQIYVQKNDFRSAGFSFCMASIMNTADVEGWVNCSISYLNCEAFELLPLIIKTAFYFNGEEYFESLYKSIELSNNPEYLNFIMETIDSILPDRNREEKEIFIRALNSNGIFEIL